MIKQYPHLLYSEDLPGEATKDDDGNWISQTAAVSLISVCREVTDGRGRELQGADGKFYKYTSTIFLPKSCPDLAFGTDVFVRDNEASASNRIKAKVLKFDRGQLHCRLWI